MSNVSNNTVYVIQISAQQPIGGVYEFQQNLYAEADFGDAEAEAMFNATLASIPSAWSPSASMTKIVSDQTDYNWNKTTGVFE